MENERKQYATPSQKKLLAELGVDHVPGRSYSEANYLLLKAVNDGVLAHDELEDAASSSQTEYLRRLGFKADVPLKHSEAGQLIRDSKRLGRPVTTISERQTIYIEKLGGKPDFRMTLEQAAEYIRYLLSLEIDCKHCKKPNLRRVIRCQHCNLYTARPPIEPPPFPWTYEVAPPKVTPNPRPIIHSEPTLLGRLLAWLGW